MPCDVAALLLDALGKEWRRERSTTADRVEVDPDATVELALVALTRVSDLLPCDRCKGAETDIAKLGRLGKHERRILLAAPPPTAEAVILDPPRPSPASVEAHRRARHCLAAARLLSLGWSKGRAELDPTTHTWRRLCLRRTARRTPLGQAVVERLSAQLEHGERIRWARHRPALWAAVQRPVPELLAAFRERLVARRAASIALASVLASLGREVPAASAADEGIAEIDALLRAVDVACDLHGSTSGRAEVSGPVAKGNTVKLRHGGGPAGDAEKRRQLADRLDVLRSARRLSCSRPAK